MRNTATLRYGSLSIALHWLMLALIAAVYACIELHDLFPKGSATRDAVKSWHFMLGLSVLLLVGVRLVVRWLGSTPSIEPPLSAWQSRAARAGHVVLYAFMIGMPIMGWLTLSASGKVIPFFGAELPALIGVNKELGKSIKEIHETIGTAGFYLIGLHAAAALYHHYVRRDSTLVRMLPMLDRRER
ncbi:MAG: cytochrome b [Burkholderiaceae bacterium]